MKQLLLLFAIAFAFTAPAQTIYEIQGQQSTSPLANSSVNTGGIVTGVAADGYFIQDGTGAWNGIYVYDQIQNPTVGDQVTLTATVTEYFTLTELGNVTNFEVVSTGNPLPEPVTVSTADANMEDYEGVFIRVEGAVCTNPDLGFNEFEINDGSGTIVVDDLIYLFVASQDVEYNIQGIGYFSFDFAKILPTQASDVELASPLYYVNQPEEYNLANASMDINWTTNAPSNTILSYGLTTQYELGSIQLDELVTEHTVQLSGLTPATVYYIQAVSQDTENSTPVAERVVCTASESSGEIKVYFNHPVDTEVATVSDATNDADIIATIVEYIGMAQNTLDITMYDVQGCDASIINAINAAHNNGVTVRYLTDEELENIELDDLDPSIPILAGNPVGIMHNKFIVIDRDNVDNTWVITGSTNHTWANMGWDYNNMICIQDQSLAHAYTLEFEEMWGTTADVYDLGTSLFSGDKTDNTPHKFNLNGIEAELYFSPSDGTENFISEELMEAESEIIFAIMAFTSNPLGNALVAQNNNGISIQGIIDYVEFSGSEYDYLQSSGINVLDYQNADGTQWPDGPVFHHKYAITDYQPGSAHPAVISGSHNWTASANTINDENTLIIRDHEVANWFYQEFVQRWADLPNMLPELADIRMLIYPNPGVDSFALHSDETAKLSLYNLKGQLVLQSYMIPGVNTVDVSSLPSGSYVVHISGNHTAFAKWVKQ